MQTFIHLNKSVYYGSNESCLQVFQFFFPDELIFREQGYGYIEKNIAIEKVNLKKGQRFPKAHVIHLTIMIKALQFCLAKDTQGLASHPPFLDSAAQMTKYSFTVGSNRNGYWYKPRTRLKLWICNEMSKLLCTVPLSKGK